MKFDMCILSIVWINTFHTWFLDSVENISRECFQLYVASKYISGHMDKDLTVI